MIGRYRLKMHYCTNEMWKRGHSSTRKGLCWMPNGLRKSEISYKNVRKYLKKSINGHRFICPSK